VAQGLTGAVASFDGAAGHGTVRGEDGRELFFHCTAVADGSRTIDVGAAVTYRVTAGHHGRWEATDIVLAGGVPAPPGAPTPDSSEGRGPLPRPRPFAK
jgi:cold shock CspA family protein